MLYYVLYNNTVFLFQVFSIKTFFYAVELDNCLQTCILNNS